jgi:transposase
LGDTRSHQGLRRLFPPSLGELTGPLTHARKQSKAISKDSIGMAFLQHQPSNCLGFDIAKDTITVSDGLSRRGHTIANTHGAIRAFLKRAGPDFVVCEPTGGYELALLDEAMRGGIASHRVDIARFKGFIRSLGALGKTDAMDAAMLAVYGRERWSALALRQKPDAQEAQLKLLVRRRHELMAIKNAEQNRAKAPAYKPLAASFKAVIATIQRQIEAIEGAIAAVMRQSSRLAHRAAIITSMNGIGAISAAGLLALLPELGAMSRRQAAALAGVAPHPADSGTKHGYRKMRGGRPEIRTILFMPALRAAAGNGEFANYYKRLVANGKKPIVAIAAVMRKIVVTLNARLRDNTQIPQS